LIPAILVMGAVLVAQTGCAKSKPLRVSLEGTTDLNGGYACRVRIYQLKAYESFLSAPLETFWSGRPQAFEADLAETRAEEVTLEPGTSEDVTIKISKETRFIGAAADFRRPDRDAWRKVLPFSAKKGLIPAPLRKGQSITLTVSSRGIEIKT